MGTGAVEGTTLTLVGMIGTFIASLVTGGYWFRSQNAALEKKIEDNSKELRKEFLDVREEARTETGDSVAAVRAKIGAVEAMIANVQLESERAFVRKQEFQNVVDSFTRSIDSLRNDMNGQYTRINDKLDQVIQGRVGPTAPHR